MSFSTTLSAILDEPTTAKFVPGTDRADFGPIDLASNPQKTSQGFSWFLPNRVTEATITFVGRVAYDVIGDKTEEYFSLPGEQWVCTTASLPLGTPVFLTTILAPCCDGRGDGKGQSRLCCPPVQPRPPRG